MVEKESICDKEVGKRKVAGVPGLCEVGAILMLNIDGNAWLLYRLNSSVPRRKVTVTSSEC